MSLANDIDYAVHVWNHTGGAATGELGRYLTDRLEQDYVIIPRSDLPAAHVPALEGHKYAGTAHTADHARNAAIKLLGVAESIERRDARDAEQKARIDRRRNELAVQFSGAFVAPATYAQCSPSTRRAIDAYIELESGVKP